MASHDRYALAIAMLDGDRDARKVLADLLEEQGERSLAQWARGRMSSHRRRLGIAIMLIPSRAAIRLALDCVRHSVVVEDNQADAGQMMEAIEMWRTGRLSSADFEAQADRILPKMAIKLGRFYNESYMDQRHPFISDWPIPTLQHLFSAVKYASCGENHSPSDGASVQHYEMLARKESRECIYQAGLLFPAADWQMDRIKAVLKHLTSPLTVPWPPDVDGPKVILWPK